MAAMPRKGSSRAASFKARLTSTVFLWGIVAGVFASGQLWALAGMVGVLALLGNLEFLVLTRSMPGVECRRWALAVAILFLVLLIWQTVTGSLDATGDFVYEIMGLVAVTLGSFILRLKFPIENDDSVRAVTLAVVGFIYIPILFAGFIIRLTLCPPVDDPVTSGFWVVLLVVLVAKFTDMGAYLVGTLIGKHKAIPHISPAKSWEGYLGSLAFAQAGAFSIYALAGERLAWLAAGHVASLGFLLALAAMVGDLAESILKRSLQVKDSGHLLPGIGGILDLVDSLCFALPVAYFYLYLIVL